MLQTKNGNNSLGYFQKDKNVKLIVNGRSTTADQ